MGRADSYIPALKFGHKVYPENIAGMLGLASVGDLWYVDAANGSDTANAGKKRSDAYATVGQALSSATADQDDVILVVGGNSTGRTSESSALAWNKRRTHLMGVGQPKHFNPRVGMSFGSATGSPSMTISTRDCIFKNISIAQFNDVNVMVNMTDGYNYFENVHFQGIANADAGDDDNARILTLTGSDENEFNGCTFGVDTVLRTGSNASVEFIVSQNNSRNIFNDCIFTMIADADAPRHIKTNNGGSNVDRFALFNHCFFFCNSDLSSGTTQTDVFDCDDGGDQGGQLIVKDCMQVGHTGWTNQVNAVKILGAITNDTELTNYSTGVNPSA